MKKTFTSKDKARIALKALEEGDTLSAIASKNDVHPRCIGYWRKKLKEDSHLLFDKSHTETKKIKELETQVDELHRLIGKRDEELAWLKKNTAG